MKPRTLLLAPLFEVFFPQSTFLVDAFTHARARSEGRLMRITAEFIDHVPESIVDSDLTWVAEIYDARRKY